MSDSIGLISELIRRVGTEMAEYETSHPQWKKLYYIEKDLRSIKKRVHHYKSKEGSQL